MRKNAISSAIYPFALPPAAASFRQLPPAPAAYYVLAFVSPRNHPFGGGFGGGMGNYLLWFGSDFCAKAQFLAIFTHFCFRQLPEASASFRSLLPSRIRPMKPYTRGVGNYLLTSGWDFFAKTQFLALFTHLCASVSIRIPHEAIHLGVGVIY